VRTARFDPQQGFFLNGKNMKLKGVCLHDDAGCLGTAVPERAWERRLELLREMGCNAIRMSHNPPAPEVLDLCDRMGFLVIDEAFDKWKSGYYSAHYDAWWQRDLDAMIQRDRNHPSIILWSVGNEVREQGSTEGTQRLKELVARVHETEPTRPVTYAAHPGREPMCINNNGFADAMDVVCYNYQEPWYELDKQLDPQRIVVGSECYPFWHGRSDYHTDRKLHNFYCDFAPVNPWYDVVQHDYVTGEFIWIGIDYLGESIGWPSKGWPNGLFDTCGFAKPRAGFHRSVWNTDPFVQIAVLDDSFDIDHGAAAWSWPKMARNWNRTTRDVIARVQTVTNADSVELLLNGESLGTRKTADYPNATLLWYVPYRSGHLKAIAKNDGREVTTDELYTAGVPARILLKGDRSLIAADGQDIAHLEVALVDAKGVLVPNDDRKIRFDVTGSGKLAGTDNGDLRSTEPYQGNERTTRWGRCLAVVRAYRQAGEIRLTATTDGLPTSTAVIHSQDSEPQRPASERR